MRRERLEPRGGVVRLGRSTIRTPGLTGTVIQHEPLDPGTRGRPSLSSSEADAILVEHELDLQETFEITGVREVPTVGASTPGVTTGAEPIIELTVPAPNPAWGQLVMYTDEGGVTTWHSSPTLPPTLDVVRGAATRIYTIPHRSPPAATGDTRGPLGAAGKALLRTLVFPLLGDTMQAAGRYFATRWERSRRSYRLRSFTPDDYNRVDARELSGEDWLRLGSGAALLFVHGTFSRAHSAFGALTRNCLEALHRQYEGRVFAFDHFTISDDPQANVGWLLARLPERVRLSIDIVSHSRGGLVARLLAEPSGPGLPGSAPPGDRRIEVRRVVLVGVPNGGTPLADQLHLDDFVNSYTNVFNFFPDTLALDGLDAAVEVAKQLAVHTVEGLPGLRAMLPDGEFLHAALNAGRGSGARYFAIASDFQPAQAVFRGFATRLGERVFANAPHDMVVPAESVYGANGSPLFPVADRYVFDRKAGVLHTGYFRNAITEQKVLEWLGAAGRP